MWKIIKWVFFGVAHGTQSAHHIIATMDGWMDEWLGLGVSRFHTQREHVNAVVSMPELLFYNNNVWMEWIKSKQ